MSQELVIEPNITDQKNLARIIYVVHGLTFFFSLGLMSIVPLIVNYVKRPETSGTYLYSHHSWMIRSFWWYIAWCFVSIVLALTFFLMPVAIVVFLAAWIWKAYRLVRGFLDLESNREMPR